MIKSWLIKFFRVALLACIFAILPKVESLIDRILRTFFYLHRTDFSLSAYYSKLPYVVFFIPFVIAGFIYAKYLSKKNIFFGNIIVEIVGAAIFSMFATYTMIYIQKTEVGMGILLLPIFIFFEALSACIGAGLSRLKLK